jgi:hypothetical protein
MITISKAQNLKVSGVNMKKAVIIIGILFVTIVIFIASYIVLPKKINTSYDGIAYSIQDPSYSKKVTIQLAGQYNKKSNTFQGLMRINNISYTNSILSSGFSAIFYEANTRHLMGRIYFDDDFRNLSMEVEDSQIYREITHEVLKTGKLILSFTATDRSSAIRINSALKEK